MSGMKLHRPGPDGLEENPVEQRTWRTRLRSRRWSPAPLANAELEPSSARMTVLFWLALAALTFTVIVVGYGIGFWGPIS